MATVMRNFFVITSLCLLSSLFISCNKNVVFSQYTTLPEEGWKTENKLSYTVDIKDNKPYHNVFLTVRHADSYQFSNLFVFLTTTYPNGKISVDTLECILANKKGEWQGDGAGDLWDNKIPLKQNLIFPQTGTYTFTFEQGMRQNPLPLILDFGMVIEKVEN
jgi:gliding motility-associated lipoprotein GldH